MPKKPPKPFTKQDVEIGKDQIRAKAKGDLASAVWNAYYGPDAKLGIAGQPEGPMRDELDKAKTRLEQIDQATAEFGRWAGKARTDIKGYNPFKK